MSIWRIVYFSLFLATALVVNTKAPVYPNSRTTRPVQPREDFLAGLGINNKVVQDLSSLPTQPTDYDATVLQPAVIPRQTSGCSKLQSLMSNASELSSTMLDSQEYQCVDSQILLAASNTSIGGSQIPDRPTFLVGIGATIRVSAQNVSLHHLTLVGDWRIDIDAAGSLLLSTLNIDMARVRISEGGELHATGLSVRRLSESDAALHIDASHAAVRIDDSLFSDGFPGALLAIRGDAASISLRNATFESTEPLSSPDLLSVYVVGLSLALNRSSAAVAHSHFRWCGLGAVSLTGAASSLTVLASSFFQNSAVSFFGSDVGGGAIGASGPALSLAVVDCSIVGHWSDTGGGGVSLLGDDGRLLLRGTALDANQAGEAGGAVRFRGARGALVVAGCRMRDNIVFGFDGGAVAFESAGGAAEVEDSRFAGNIAYRAGGALSLAAARVAVARCVVEGNVATAGGGVHCVAGEASFADSLLRGNLAGGADGGGVRLEFCGAGFCGSAGGNLRVFNCTLEGNAAEDGGGIAVIGWGSAVLASSRIEGNVAFGSGGGVLHNRTGPSPAPPSRASDLEMTGCAVARNVARHGDGGGFAALNGGIRVSETTFSGNEAALGSGGGLAVSGYPYGSADGVWSIRHCLFRANHAGESGGGVASRNLFFYVDTVSSGFGIPFALRADLTVLCRGYGVFNDRNVVAFHTQNSTLWGVFNETLFDTSNAPALDTDSLVAGISKDDSIVLMYLNWKFQLVAVNVTSGQILSTIKMPAVPSYTRVNQVAGSLSDTLPVLIPKIADTNYYWYYVYGGWGLSSAVTEDMIFVSTFHRTVVFHISNASFQELHGCESGVSAMALSAAHDSLYLARYSGSGYAFFIFQYSISDRECQPYSWKDNHPEFKQIRALAVSADDESIYIAETYQWVDQLAEHQVIKMVNLKSGAVSFFSSSPTSYLLLDSVVAILPLKTGSLTTELFILCAPGGWLGGVDGQGSVSWTLHMIRTGEMKMSKITLFENSARISGGAVASSDVSVMRIEESFFADNYANRFGGAAISKDSSFLMIVESRVQNNYAGEGGALCVSDSAQVIVTSSNFTANSAAVCGGAVMISGTKNLVLNGYVVVEKNSAGNGGGVCIVRSSNQSQPYVNGVWFMLSISSQSTAVFKSNVAARGGGAVFDSYPNVEINSGANPNQLTNLGNEVLILFYGNDAGYGPNIATPPSKFVLLNRTRDLEYYPGERLRLLLVIEDGFGQVIKYKGNSVPMSVTIQTSSPESGLISETYHGFDLHGICDLDTTPPQVFWPARELHGKRTFDSTIMLYMQLVTTDQLPLLPIILQVSRAPCPDGTSYDAITQSCGSCLRSQYVISPNDENECKDCPLGAVCNGSVASSRVAGAMWRRVGDTLRISECPAGYILVRDETQPITDDCIKCPPGKFQTIRSIHNPVDNLIWSSTASQASYLCEDCPDGYKCLGGEEIKPADIEVYPWNSSEIGKDITPHLQCRKKLTVCGSFEIQDEIRFVFTDNRLGSETADITYLIIAGDVFINGSSARKSNTSENKYYARFNLTDLGIHILAVYLNGVQIPNSPFLFAVTKRSCMEYHGRISDLRGSCVCAELATLDIGGTCVSLILVAVSSAAALSFIFGVVYCIRKFFRSEEDNTRRTVEELRAKLELSNSLGFMLSSDVYPIWRNTKFLIFIQRSYLEAAARLALFRDDCDVKLLNGLCVCLLERPHQYGLFCEWLLAICTNLLDPSANITLQASGASTKESTLLDQGRRFRNVHHRRVQCTIDSKALNLHERFQYFLEKVSKVQAMRDSVVFEKLQLLSQIIMDKLADLCNCRFEELSHEPSGSELLSSKFTDVVDLTPSNSLAPSNGEHFFCVNGCVVSRQDSDQVAAIRTDEINSKEAMQQIQARSSNMLRQPLNEGVFLAQLALRAELLNRAFQDAVAELITAHAATDNAIATAAAAAFISPEALLDYDRRSQERDRMPLHELKSFNAWGKEYSSFNKLSNTLPKDDCGVAALNLAPILVECQFTQDIDIVEIHPAPIKSLRRMQEKLSEYLLPGRKGTWPLAANILDPVRLSLVTNGPSHLLQVVQWLLEEPGKAGLTVCRLKNLFALPRGLVPDGYRDIKLFIIYSGPNDLKLIGEVQVHDREMYKLKQRMHYLYRIKRAHGPESI